MKILFYSCVGEYDYHKLLERIPSKMVPLVEKYKKQTDKDTHLISYLMKKTLSLGKPIEYNQYGKPLAEGVHFNVSHDGSVVVGISDVRQVGIDVIQLNRRIQLNLLKSSFTPTEWRLIAVNRLTVLKWWSLKEAFLKMLGVGLTIPLNTVEITASGKVFLDNQVQDCVLDYIVTQGYGIAVCVEGKNKLRSTIVDFNPNYSDKPIDSTSV